MSVETIPRPVLRDFDFRQLFFADTVSQLGSQVSLLALPLVAVLVLGASTFEVGALAACDTAAFLFVGLPAGAWVDRMRRRHVLIAGDAGRALLLASVPLAAALHHLTIYQLYAVGLGVGVLTVFFDVAYQSYLPTLVGRDRLVDGNAKLEAVRGVTALGGPTLAGFLIQLLRAPNAILVDAISFAGSALFVGRIRIREPKPEPGPDAHLGREIAEGLRFVLGNRILRGIAACTGISNFFGSLGGAVLIVLFARELKLGAFVIGLFFSLASVGGIGGALIARRLAVRLGEGPVIWMSIAFAGPWLALVPIARRDWTLGLAALGFAVWGACGVIYNVNQLSFRQRLAPDRLLGRMNATMRFLVWGTLPIGALVGGVLGQVLGVRPTLWISFAGGLLAFLPVYFSPLRTMRELPSQIEQ